VVDLSIVIPFRNRDARRVAMSASSFAAACTGLSYEIIVTDGGSSDIDEVAAVVHQIGATLIRTPANHWNKPQVMNAAIELAQGTWVLCADADMLWEPGSIASAIADLRSSERSAVLAFQTRDLPAGMTEPILHDHATYPWRELRRASRLHSRWGNGVLLFPRDLARAIGGYDLRLSVYGTEDVDFCNRMQSAGAIFRWSNPDRQAVFHVWHPTLQHREKRLPWAARALERNRAILRNDKTVVRNAVGAGGGEPLVTVAIVTQDRAEMLRTAIASVLCQTVQAFEVVVVDDGSTDHTAEVVAAFDDERIRYFHQQPAGISAARNRALRESRGRFTAVMDDDDIMPPWRLERSFESIHGNEHGCVGTFVTFDDTSGDLLTWGDPFPTLLGAYAQGGFAGHPTWMVRTDILRTFGYDESFTSAVDNNIALRMIRSGVKLRHAGSVMNLRRVHTGQITSHDSAFQGRGARLDATWLRAGNTTTEWQAAAEDSKKTQRAPAPAPAQRDETIPYLPDHLVHRDVTARTTHPDAAAQIRDRHPDAAHVELTHPDGSRAHLFHITDATWADCAHIHTRPHTTITHWHGTLRTTTEPDSKITTRARFGALDEIFTKWAAAGDLRAGGRIALRREAPREDATRTPSPDERLSYELGADAPSSSVVIRIEPRD
jgi:glycosyltransferase involved in cell wall biosynthesis